jgi:hypothetical protein
MPIPTIGLIAKIAITAAKIAITAAKIAKMSRKYKKYKTPETKEMGTQVMD